ncbi:DUF3365 domain-containing protein [Thiomicrorhabdus sp. 6S3-12]|uniref:Tll0287-like domain-containing protein n=1 Tax=Thiomicrorhabdus sp. 6S3-12 TaxID=2819681 RepID=UPI001AAD979C|nr:DUF3365 domain-containing protein [Thiomicrorhabdus sp. 6S3-12]MBO1923267.1 DUF3365 domain-containing protein [Thiomicrorhabdus sp. 6S3-12]
MKKILLTALIGGLTLNAHASAVNSDLQEARQMAKEFGGQLKPALKGAMKAGGPIEAVAMCNTKAPAIAKAVSEKHDWNVNRVSLKPRGATATPDAWETQTLKWFEEQIAAGVSPKTLEKFEIVKADGKETIRYMKPVMTGGVCLTCHGSAQQIPDGVKAKLAQLYPNDKATGFKEGDIRGAFSFQKTAN